MARYKAFEPTELQLQQIEIALRVGLSHRQIAVQLNVSPATVSRVVRTHFELRRREAPKKGVR